MEKTTHKTALSLPETVTGVSPLPRPFRRQALSVFYGKVVMSFDSHRSEYWAHFSKTTF